MPDTDPLPESGDPVERGRAFLRRGKLLEARTCFEEAIAENAFCVEAHEGAATVAYIEKDDERAAGHFEAAARADSRRAEPLINLGAVQNRQKQYGKAIKTLQKALSRDRKNSDAYFNLGIAYRGNNQLGMATNAYKEAIRLRIDFAEAHQNLGLAYLEAGNSRQAKTSLQRAVDLRPGLKRAVAGLAAANAADRKRSDPLGRLVDSLEAKNNLTAGNATLSDADRSDDRTQVAELATRLERSLDALRVELHGATEPAIQQTCRAIAGGERSPRVQRELAVALRESVESCHHLLKLVDEHIAALQEHESAVAALLRTSR